MELIQLKNIACVIEFIRPVLFQLLEDRSKKILQ